MKMGTSLQLTASATAIALSTTACSHGQVARIQAPGSLAVTPAKEASFADRAHKTRADRKAADAVVAAERAVAASPHDAGCRAQLGKAYLADGRFASAEMALRDSLALSPDQPATVLRLAIAQIGRNDFGGAHATLAAAPTETPPADLGLAFALSGDTEAGIALLDNAARSHGADARVRQNLALAYAIAGRWEEARAIAAQDLPANEVNAQLLSWTQIANARAGWQPIAALFGVKPMLLDPGQPEQLALAPEAAPQATAVAMSAPVDPAPQASVIEPVTPAPVAAAGAIISAAPSVTASASVPAEAAPPLVASAASPVKAAAPDTASASVPAKPKTPVAASEPAPIEAAAPVAVAAAVPAKAAPSVTASVATPVKASALVTASISVPADAYALLAASAPAPIKAAAPVAVATSVPAKAVARATRAVARQAPVTATASISVKSAPPVRKNTPAPRKSEHLVATVERPVNATRYKPNHVVAEQGSPPLSPLTRVASIRQVRTARGGWAVQLGAYGSEKRTEAGWKEAVAQYRELNAYIAAGSVFQLHGATLHRLSIAGLPTLDAARRVCRAIKSRGGDCFVRNAADDAPLEWALRAVSARHEALAMENHVIAREIGRSLSGKLGRSRARRTSRA
jgi:Flp pilus assembly protein TadD